MLMHGFFGKKQYEAIAPSMFTTKFSKERCLECSTWAMFFSSSLMVSIIARFLRSTLSETLIIAPFMLLLSFVISWIPQANSLLNSSPSWYSLCHRPTFSLQMRCSLKPKNHPMEHLPRCAIPLKTLWMCILWFLHTLSGVLSTKLIPVHLPSRTFLMKMASGTPVNRKTCRNHRQDRIFQDSACAWTKWKILSSVNIARVCCGFCLFHFKFTTNPANHQIINQLYFVELTLIYQKSHRLFK